MKKKFNYFDDVPDETLFASDSKKASAARAALAGLKRLEATVCEEAEEDIAQLNELPLLKHAIKKAVVIAGIILLIIIFVVSFSVSLKSKTKRAEQFNKDAGNICINYIKSYGSIKWEELDSSEYGENKAKLTGLCYVRQMDFNGDGTDELMLCYSDSNVYYLEVWGYHKKDFVRLYKDEANSTDSETDGSWVSFYRKGDKYYICKSEKSNSETLKLYAMRSGSFKQKGTAQYDIKTQTYTLNGKESSSDFETVKLSCFRKSRADIIVEQVTQNIDSFGDITSQAISNSLTDAQLKNNAYCEIVKKRLDKYGEPSVQSDDDEKYIDGLALVRLVDFDGDGNEELLLVYRTYKSLSKYDNYSGEYIYYDEPRYSLDVYEWNGVEAKRIINKDSISVYLEDDNVFYLLLKKGKKTVSLCSNTYDMENKYSYTAYSKIYTLKDGAFKVTYDARLVNDYGYKTYYIDDERVYSSEWDRKGHKVPFFLDDEDTADESKYEMIYFSGNETDTYEQTVNQTVKEIQALDKEYTPSPSSSDI